VASELYNRSNFQYPARTVLVKYQRLLRLN